MMKRLKEGHIIHMPFYLSGNSKRHRSLFILKAVLIGAIFIGLAFSALLTLRMQEAVARGSAGLPADHNRIDASGAENAFEGSVVDPRLFIGTEMPVIYGVNVDETKIGGTENGETQPRPGSDDYHDVRPKDFKMEILEFANDFHVGTQGPQILIYHTHTLEAYRQIEGKKYVEAGTWRTEDHDSSVVAVGEILKTELESYGYIVLHDITNHEPPSLITAYSRSLETMKKYAKEYPTLRVFIDVHRDANMDTSDFVTIDGEECARIMFVVDDGEGYDVKPDYESNFKLAYSVTKELEKIHKGFTRPVCIKSHSHNQNVSDMCLLIEVGHNANSLEQAKNAAKYAALAISRVVSIG